MSRHPIGLGRVGTWLETTDLGVSVGIWPALDKVCVGIWPGLDKVRVGICRVSTRYVWGSGLDKVQMRDMTGSGQGTCGDLAGIGQGTCGDLPGLDSVQMRDMSGSGHGTCGDLAGSG